MLVLHTAQLIQAWAQCVHLSCVAGTLTRSRDLRGSAWLWLRGPALQVAGSQVCHQGRPHAWHNVVARIRGAAENDTPMPGLMLTQEQPNLTYAARRLVVRVTPAVPA
jgi:hypothetical protein